MSYTTENTTPRLLTCATALGLAFTLLGCGDDGGNSNTGGASSTTTTTATTTTTTSSSSTSTGSSGGGGAPSVDPRVEACLRLNACEADGGTPIGIQTCLSHELDVPWKWSSSPIASIDLAIMECKLAATDCAAVRACTPKPGDFNAACLDHASSSLCQGNTAVFCDDLGAAQVAMDCAAAKLSCTSSSYASGCGAKACDPTTTESMCDPNDKDVLITCGNSGALERVHCPTQYSYVHVNSTEGDKVFSIAGETCGFDKQRNAFGCIGTGDACPFFSQKCDGAVLETCAGGKLSRRDCAKVEPAGQGCGFIQSGAFAGAASCGLLGGACDLGTAGETCSDGVIHYCNWSAPADLDCRALGYGGCAQATKGDRTVAYCTP